MKKIIEILKWDLTTYKRSYMLQVIGIFGIILAIMILPEFSAGSVNAGNNFAELGSTYIGMLNTIVACIYLTMLSSPFDGKQQKISYLMLPASLRQKFVARLIIVLVLVPLVLTVCTMVADMIQMVLFFMISMGVPPHSYTVVCAEGFVTMITDIAGSFKDIYSLMSLLFIPGFVGFFICFGLMCGAIWTRKAFLKSICLGFAFLFVAVTSSAIFAITELNIDWIIDPGNCHTEITEMREVYCVLSVIAMVLIYAFDGALLKKGYKTFVNRQLIGNDGF